MSQLGIHHTSTRARPSVPTSREFGANVEAARIVDEELESLEAQIRDIKVHRNTLVLIARLPPEILSTVFLILRDVPPSLLPQGTGMEWMAVSCVCTHWRQVALNCPDLWSHIDIRRNSAFVEAFLERSKQVPLIFSAKITHSSQKDVGISLTNMCRMRRLFLFSQTHLLNASLLNTLETHPAPLLEQFSLGWPTKETSTPAKTLTSLFGGIHPVLRKLRLIRCNISWNFPPFTTLVDLFIEGAPSRDAHCPSVAQLISILQNTPCLENLNIVGTIPSPPADVAPSTSVLLPHLAVMGLRSGIRQCIELLGHMSYPAASVIHIDSLGVGSYTLEEASEIVHRVLNSERLIGTRPPIQYLRVRSPISFDYGDGLLTVEAWDSLDNLRDEPFTVPRIELAVYMSTDDSTLLTEVDHIGFWDALPLEGLHTLDIIDLDVQEPLWLRLFGRLEGLTILKFKPLLDDGPTSILEASTFPPFITNEGHDQNISQEFPGVYLPALRELSISEWNFKLSSVGSEQTSILLNYLARFLMTRENLGAGIEALNINSCRNLSWDAVEELKKLVPNIHWDVLVAMSEDEEDDS
ncbi:hypothetical protein BDZ94DRAFT_280124 [Collybia nuda]|uniref:F-box domain-containing protein n=1 Tax=Collybia nuda TaxID=64659 RepID=A0A9P6CMR2_9AGAR|nr:hypothetical protein BDZ94DRAFT_280124 [Collybia nuda]